MRDLDDIRGWIAVLNVAREEKARAEGVIAQAREKIEDALGDEEVGALDGQPVVRWTYVTSTRFDQKKARSLLGDAADACVIETSGRRFTVVGDDE